MGRSSATHQYSIQYTIFTEKLKIFPNTEAGRLPGVIFDPVLEPSSVLSDG
jgi:hypothetical protein